MSADVDAQIIKRGKTRNEANWKGWGGGSETWKNINLANKPENYNNVSIRVKTVREEETNRAEV